MCLRWGCSLSLLTLNVNNFLKKKSETWALHKTHHWLKMSKIKILFANLKLILTLFYELLRGVSTRPLPRSKCVNLPQSKISQPSFPSGLVLTIEPLFFSFSCHRCYCICISFLWQMTNSTFTQLWTCHFNFQNNFYHQTFSFSAWNWGNQLSSSLVCLWQSLGWTYLSVAQESLEQWFDSGRETKLVGADRVERRTPAKKIVFKSRGRKRISVVEWRLRGKCWLNKKETHLVKKSHA